MRGLSMLSPGTFAGCEPTAMMPWPNVTCSVPPSSSATSRLVGPTSVAVPRRYLILRALTSCPVPLVSCATTWSLKPRSLPTSIFGAPNDTPQDEAWAASSITLATCSRAFDGMQPR